jgi:NitT/TauT family transport system substrate-binding protein
MKPVSCLLYLLVAAALVAPGFTSTAHAIAKKEFNIAWTIYVGWMPWPYSAEAGIVKKWADKYGISIKITQINDYVESINQYTAGKFDGVTLTNMDALTIPAAGGVDTTAIIMGDFSNGNDGIVLKNAKTLSDIKGRRINIVELSVSHYLLARGLTSIYLIPNTAIHTVTRCKAWDRALPMFVNTANQIVRNADIPRSVLAACQ